MVWRRFNEVPIGPKAMMLWRASFPQTTVCIVAIAASALIVAEITIVPLHSKSNLQFYGDIAVGTPPHPVSVLFDTGRDPLSLSKKQPYSFIASNFQKFHSKTVSPKSL
uniref:Peptidase A1 domain-containing protein n=1 Tax=Spongospora subterranea TaxID=70186 RepID=A0A0H5RAY1_9EUKA|eukprot:CRZ11335.1 hypothetical protein [Spongospora subterranea]